MKHSKENSFGLNISVINCAAQGYFQRRLKKNGIGKGQQAYVLSMEPGELISQDELAKETGG